MVVVLAKAQAGEFARKFEQELLLVSHLSSSTILIGAWLLDSVTTCYMIGARELFESFIESDLDVYLELGVGTIDHLFQLGGQLHMP